MKTIKYNRNQLKKNISKTLVTASTTLLGLSLHYLGI